MLQWTFCFCNLSSFLELACTLSISSEIINGFRTFSLRKPFSFILQPVASNKISTLLKKQNKCKPPNKRCDQYWTTRHKSIWNAIEQTKKVTLQLNIPTLTYWHITLETQQILKSITPSSLKERYFWTILSFIKRTITYFREHKDVHQASIAKFDLIY